MECPRGLAKGVSWRKLARKHKWCEKQPHQWGGSLAHTIHVEQGQGPWQHTSSGLQPRPREVIEVARPQTPTFRQQCFSWRLFLLGSPAAKLNGTTISIANIVLKGGTNLSWASAVWQRSLDDCLPPNLDIIGKSALWALLGWRSSASPSTWGRSGETRIQHGIFYGPSMRSTTVPFSAH